ncbi:APC family permease [Microbacterium sp. LMI13-1-1.1]
MAWNAPLVIVFFSIPVIVGFGNGIGAPGMFLVAGATIGLFAVGFTRMTKILPKPGAFYAYITAGLGKRIGLGAGLVTLVGYFCGYAGTFAFGGIAANLFFHGTLGLPELPWYVWGAIIWAIIAVLGYLKFSISATIMAIFLGLELLMIVIYNIAVFAQRGAAGAISVEPLLPANWLGGSVAIGLLFALGMFGGFEITALFRSEVKNPSRTVPVATFMVVGVATVLYVVTSWAFINAAGVDRVVDDAAAEPTASMTATFLAFGGRVLVDFASAMVLTSTFAVILAGHNIVSRYLFNLGADRILPRALSRVHPIQGSPHRASMTASVAAFALNIVFVIIGVDPSASYAMMLGMTSLVLIVVMFITNIAIGVYLHRYGRREFSFWARVVSPAISGIVLAIGVFLAVTHFNELTGGSAVVSDALMVVLALVFIGGFALAWVYRTRRPDVYELIGRQ